MRFALDTNILAYAEGVHGIAHKIRARLLIDRLHPPQVCIPVQVLCELFRLLIRRLGRSPFDSRKSVLIWHDTYTPLASSSETVVEAMELVVSHKLSFWDAVIVAASAEAGCNLLLTEDMQDGFTWRGLTIANPFNPNPHPVLRDLLSTPH